MSQTPSHVTPQRVALHVLGDFQVTGPDGPVVLPQSRKTRALLAYLACTGRPHRRERLCELFWEIPDDPRGALRWSLSKMRQIVGAALEADRNLVRLAATGVALDLEELRAVSAQPLEASPVGRLEAVAACFRGPFLADMYLQRCPEFEAWRTAIADECELARIRLLRHLVARLATEPQRALVHAHALQDLLPDEPDIGAEITRLRRAAREAAAGAPAEKMPATGAAATLAPAPAEPSAPATRDMAAKLRASVLAIDLVSPVQIFEMVDPEATAAQFEPVHAEIEAIARRFGGQVLELGNGQALVGFGVAPASEDHALLACRAALDLAAMVRIRTDGAVRMRAAIDTGDVILHDRGGAVAALSGAAPRQSRRLAHALRRDGIVLTGRARAAAGGYVRAARLDHADLSGVGRDEECWLLEHENKALSRWHLRLHQATMPLMAREAELFALHAAWRRTRSGAGQVVAVSGDAGLGKSRLVHEFCDSIAAEGAYFIEGGGLEPDRTVAFGVIRALAGGLCGLLPEAEAGDPARRLAAFVAELGLEPWHLPALAHLLGAGESDGPWRRFGPDERLQRVGEAVRALAVALARRSPLILLVEDLHWTDPQSEAVFARLVDAAAVAPILLIATFRDDYAAAWQSRAHCQPMRLSRFTPSECEEAVSAALGGNPGIEALGMAIVRKCDGSPLFIEEAVRGLVEAGQIDGQPGAYRAVAAPDHVTIPSTVHALVAARLMRLSTPQRLLVQAAALMPGPVGADALRRCAGLDEAMVAPSIEALVRGEFLHEISSYPVRTYALAGALVREVAADMLLSADRAAMAARIGGSSRVAEAALARAS